jgi:hypothetical protein
LARAILSFPSPSDSFSNDMWNSLDATLSNLGKSDLVVNSVSIDFVCPCVPNAGFHDKRLKNEYLNGSGDNGVENRMAAERLSVSMREGVLDAVYVTHKRVSRCDGTCCRWQWE